MANPEVEKAIDAVEQRAEEPAGPVIVQLGVVGDLTLERGKVLELGPLPPEHQGAVPRLLFFEPKRGGWIAVHVPPATAWALQHAGDVIGPKSLWVPPGGRA